MLIVVAGTSRSTSMRRGAVCGGSTGRGSCGGASPGGTEPKRSSAMRSMRSSSRSATIERMALPGR